mmetsp:Transcript_24210/g.81631  ORF Transcript_24210/g.81631 Transcript_24210/m.81631 type:complete len:283 (-) Transcript_24210:1102-1950(-)
MPVLPKPSRHSLGQSAAVASWTLRRPLSLRRLRPRPRRTCLASGTISAASSPTLARPSSPRRRCGGPRPTSSQTSNPFYAESRRGTAPSRGKRSKTSRGTLAWQKSSALLESSRSSSLSPSIKTTAETRSSTTRPLSTKSSTPPTAEATRVMAAATAAVMGAATAASRAARTAASKTAAKAPRGWSGGRRTAAVGTEQVAWSISCRGSSTRAPPPAYATATSSNATIRAARASSRRALWITFWSRLGAASATASFAFYWTCSSLKIAPRIREVSITATSTNS